MRRELVVWASAPNRHFEPILDAAIRAGALAHVYYASPSLQWPQLGTRPSPRAAALQTVLPGSRQSLGAVRAIVRRHRDARHLVVSFAVPLLHKALAACAREGVPHYAWAERLKPRPALHPKRIVRALLYPGLVRSVAGAFALSPSAALDLHALGIPRDRIHPAMFAGPDAHRPYRPAARERVVFCGRLVDRKGFDLLCRAVADLASRRPGLALDVVGDGPALRHLDLLRGTAVEVRVHGALPSARALEVMAEAAVLALPARTWEGWGYVVNEAVSLGLPAVVSTVVGAGELVVPGRTGAVFPEGDAARLAAAIGRALDLRERPHEAEAAFRLMQEGSTGDAFVRYLLDVLWRDPAARAPWHGSAEALGGNEATAWWTAWRRGDAGTPAGDPGPGAGAPRAAAR